VSHDVATISAVAKSLWICEHGTVEHFEGTIQDYKKRITAQANTAGVVAKHWGYPQRSDRAVLHWKISLYLVRCRDSLYDFETWEPYRHRPLLPLNPWFFLMYCPLKSYGVKKRAGVRSFLFQSIQAAFCPRHSVYTRYETSLRGVTTMFLTDTCPYCDTLSLTLPVISS